MLPGDTAEISEQDQKVSFIDLNCTIAKLQQLNPK